MRGRRVRLIHTSDPHTTLTSGSTGTITALDDMGTVHVKWDNGSSLGLIVGEDSWEVIDLWDIDNGCGHDWQYLDGDDRTMKCSHCGHYQN